MPCVAVFNQKGGVAKTTTAISLAAACLKDGLSPILADLDPQAHLTALSGLQGTESSASLYSFYRDHRPIAELLQFAPRGWHVIPVHLELAKVDAQFGKGPDVLNRLRAALSRDQLLCPDRTTFMDCCPSLGILSLSAVFAADRILIPVSSDYLAYKGALQVERTLNALARVLKYPPVRRYVLTRFDARRRMAWDIDRLMRDHFGESVCATRISENVALAEAAYAGKDVLEYSSNSRGAQEYLTLYAELQDSGFLAATPKPAPIAIDPRTKTIIDKIARAIAR